MQHASLLNPTAMRTLFILNPCSGHVRRKPKLPSQIRAFIKANALDAELKFTEHAGHATELAFEGSKAGIKLVVAVGGDGTVNEVASALVNSETALGIIPLGSGNGLARELGIPLGLQKALSNLLTGRLRRIDAGLANQRYFFCTAGTGLDSVVVHKFNQRVRRGFLAYLQEGLRAWKTYKPFSYKLSLDEGPSFEKTALLLTVANASQFGNNAKIFPEAKIDDGILGLTVMPQLSTLKTLLSVLRLFRGTLSKTREIEFYQGRSLQLVGQGSGIFHVDGEVVPYSASITFKLLPLALTVCCPQVPPFKH